MRILTTLLSPLSRALPIVALAAAMLLLLPASTSEAQTAGVTVSETSLAMGAGGTATYTVALNTAPTANVTIAVASGTTAAATVSPATLTFTSTDHAAKTVTVTGVAAGWSTITHTATSTDTNYSSISVGSVAVRVDATGTDALVGNVGETSLPGSFLVKTSNAFTTGSNAQGYTLTSIGLPLGSTSSGTIDVDLHSDSSGDPGTKIADLTAPTSLHNGVVYFAVPSNTPTLTASTVYHLVINGSSLDFHTTGSDNEDSGGAAGWSIANISQTYDTTNSVWVDDQFDASISFQLRGVANSLVSNVGQATGSGGYRPSDEYVTAFTTGSNAAGYTLTGIDFHIATKTASLTDAHLGTLTASVWTSGGAALTTGLDDLGTKLADLVVPSTASSVTTGPVTFAAPTGTTLAASTTYYVVIGSSAWTGGVNLLLSGTESDNEDAGKAAGFSIANTANTHTGNQFVPWTELGNSEVLSFRVSGAAKTATGPTTLTLTTNATNNTVAEDGGSVSVTATLNAAATAATSVTLTASGTATATADYTLPASALSIASGQTAATGTVSIVDDMVDEDNETVILNATVTGSTVTVSPVTLTITDNDDAGITVSSTAVGVIDGSTEVYTVKLNTAPSANVTITPTSGTTGVATVSGALTFTSTNWNMAQEVTITGVTAGTSTITHASASTDTNYGSTLTLPSVTATVLAPSTLVSNTGQTGGSCSLALRSTITYTNAFTTGSNSDGYTVTSVDVRVSVSGNGALTATHLAEASAALHQRSGLNSGTKITDLTRPSSISAGATVVTYTAPAGTHLAASTTYHVVIQGTTQQTASLLVQCTTSDDEDSSGASDWSIANIGRQRVSGNWSNLGQNAALMFAVNGGERQPMYDAGTPGVTLSKTSAATEIGATDTYTVVLDAAPTANVTITPTSGDTTKATVTGQAKTFTPANWEDAQTVTITGVAAGTTTITHAATSTDTRYNGLTGIGSVSVAVSASTKTVKFDPTTVSVNEGSNASVTVKLGRAAPSGGVALAFTYSYTGSSTASSTDTGATPASLTIASGQNTGTLSIPTTGDSLVEGDETFTVTVTTSTSNWEVPSANATATVTITDDDDDLAKIAFGNVFTATNKQTFSVAENVTGGVLTVPIILSSLPGAETTFNVTVETGGTATEYTDAQNPGDFRIATKSVTFMSTGSRQKNITIAITNDTLLEENQTIELKISDSTSGTIGALYERNAMSRLAKVTIMDDERTGAKVAFGTNVDSTSNYTANVDEDVTGGTLNVPIIINRIPEASITIPVTVMTSSTHPATENTDFSISTKSVSFGPSDTLSSGTVSKNLAITITNDSLVEEDQRITINIGDSASNNLGRHYTRNTSGARAVLTIEDDEADDAKIAFAIPVIQTAASRAEFTGNVAENVTNGLFNLSVLVSAKPESDVTVNISVVSTGTTASSADYTIATSSVTFGPDENTDQNMAIAITNDMLLEEDQTIKFRLAAAGTGLDRFYVRDTAEQDDNDGISSEATLTILDDERPGKIAFHASNAASTSKYTAPNLNETGGTIDVPVTISALPESQTSFTVEVLAAGTATEYAGTASVHEDFRVLGNKTVTFTNTGSKSKNIQVRLNNNTLVEHAETIELRIVAAVSGSAGLNKHYVRHANGARATLTVADDDASNAKIALGSNAASTMKFTHAVDEDVSGGTYAIPIKVSHSPSVDTNFELQIVTGGSGGTATDGTDYSIGTKTFTLTPTSTSATVTVTITDDAWVEDDQTIEVRIKAADTSGTTLEKYYARDANGSLGQITIEDDEQRAAKIAFGTATRTTKYTANGEEVVGTLNVPIAINHLPESNTTFTVEVLSTGTARETADSGNTAGNPKDFTIGTKTVTFGANTAKSMKLTIAIENDAVEEDDETIELRIVAKDSPVDDLGDHYDRGGSESTVGAGATATVTIKSEDQVSSVAFTTNITGTAGVQGGDILLFEGQQLVVTATADKYVGPGGWKVTVNLRPWRSSITASPNDVTLPTFTIPEGAKTATGTITIVTDTRTEQQELFHFGGNAKRKTRTVTATPTWTRARITDSGAGLTLSTSSLDLLPTEELTYTVKLNQAPTANVTVAVASSATGKATVSPATLTFTSTNYAMAQTVTVTGVAAGTANITHTVTSTDTSYTNLSNLPRVTARVTAAATTFALVVKESGLSTATAEEGDTVVLELTADTIAPSGGTQFNVVWTETPDPIVGTLGVTVSHTALTTTVSGTTTYTVRLNTQPTASVTITATSGDTDKATVTPATRTFTTSNWATPQEFTVTGVAVGSSTISHAATSTDTSYDGATVGDVAATVAATAVTPGGLALSTNAPMNRVNEGGSLLVIATLNQAAPTGGTTVTLTVDGASTAETGDYSLTTTITIAAGKTTGSQMLTTRQDNDPNNENIVLTAASTGPALTASGLTVVIVDDERGVTVTVPEGKRRVDASIRLPDDSTPSVGVKRITVRGSGPSMWTARSGKGSVRISYTDDDGGMATVAFGNNAARNNAYQATVMEDVTGGTLTVPVTVSADVDEAMTFTVRVLPDSTAREASSCPATPTATQDFRIANKTVTIAAGQTSTNLTIQICNDAFGEPNETIRLGFTPAPATARNVEDLFQRRPAGNLQAVITIDSEDVPTTVRLDNPASGVAASSANVREGQTVTVRATLDVPADQGGVTVTLVLDTTSATRHSTATNPATQTTDYVFPAPFTIPAGETTATAVIRLPTDQTVDGDKTLRFTATTSPSLTVTFSQVLQNFEIGITDIDTPGLGLSASSVTVAEGAGSQQGTAATYTVRLTTRPTANVTVQLRSEDTSKASVSPAAVMFTPTNWQSPQQVTVRAVRRGSTRITHTATSTDSTYNNATASLNVQVNPPTTTPPVVPPPPRGPTTGGGTPVNRPPTFDGGLVERRSVRENSPAGTAVGGPITATDPEGDQVRYSLGGDDAALFEIDENTGQLTVAEGAALDFETDNALVVSVKAEDIDGSGKSVSILVNIRLIDDKRLPASAENYDANGDGSISFEEAIEAVGDYTDRKLTLEQVLEVIRAYFSNGS